MSWRIMQPVHLLLGLVLSSTAGLGQQTDGGLGTRPGSLETNRYIVEFAKVSYFHCNCCKWCIS